ncbi:MAG: Rap1a/Tai family immunity protein [Candidatus Acidiferrales bacterium]
MPRMKTAFFIGIIFLSSTVCSSQGRTKNLVVSDINGSGLLRFCTSQVDTSEAEFCEAFILGIRDGVALATELRGVKPIFEAPVEAKQEQLKAVVVKYLNDHPEELHKPAGMLVILALSKAFAPQRQAAE